MHKKALMHTNRLRHFFAANRLIKWHRKKHWICKYKHVLKASFVCLKVYRCSADIQILFNASQRWRKLFIQYFTSWINCRLLEKVFHWPRRTALLDKQSPTASRWTLISQKVRDRKSQRRVKTKLFCCLFCFLLFNFYVLPLFRNASNWALAASFLKKTCRILNNCSLVRDNCNLLFHGQNRV